MVLSTVVSCTKILGLTHDQENVFDYNLYRFGADALPRDRDVKRSNLAENQLQRDAMSLKDVGAQLDVLHAHVALPHRYIEVLCVHALDVLSKDLVQHGLQQRFKHNYYKITKQEERMCRAFSETVPLVKRQVSNT